MVSLLPDKYRATLNSLNLSTNFFISEHQTEPQISCVKTEDREHKDDGDKNGATEKGRMSQKL